MPARRSIDPPTAIEPTTDSKPARPPVNARPIALAKAPRPNDAFLARLARSDDLGRFVNAPPILKAAATKMMDGRKQRRLLLVGRTHEGAPTPGALARLYVGDALVDEARLDSRGLALLRFPLAEGAAVMGGMDGMSTSATTPAKGRLEILSAHHESVKRDVELAQNETHKVIDLTMRAPRHVQVEGDAAHPTTTAARPLAFSYAPEGVLPPVDNVIDRLPSEFDTKLCQTLQSFFVEPGGASLLPAPTVPGIGPAGAPDFRQQRTPIIKRFAVVRLGEPRADTGPGTTGPKVLPPRKYIVRMRQEWIFLGYALGPLALVDGLDPGTIVQDVTRTVDNAIQLASREVDRALQTATRDVDSTFKQRATLDNVVKVSTSTTAGAAAGGFFLGIPGLFGIGGGGGVATASASATTSTSTDASLEATQSLHVAASAVNEAQRAVEQSKRELQNAVTSTIGRVSPLLTRVTNLMRWNLMENYLVCTHVEDVLEIDIATITEIDQAPGLLFTAAQIVDLARIFKPALLESRLSPRFDVLADIVDAERGAALPIVAIDVTIEYSSPASYASLRVATMGGSTGFEIVPGASTATRTIYLPTPSTATSAFASLTLALGMSPDASDHVQAGVQIARVELAFRTASGAVRTTEIGVGTTLFADTDHPTRAFSTNVQVPQPAVAANDDPLVAHVNANRAYYFGLLCTAALHEPTLRDDAPQLVNFPAEHPLWSLPIVGFEGNRAIIVRPANAALAEVQRILNDPGTASLVQLMVPGAYAEALQGLLQLAISEGLHPALQTPLPPVIPPIGIVTLPTSVPVTLPTGTGGTPIPTPTPTPPLPTP